MFQFLSRNSGRSDQNIQDCIYGHEQKFQFLSRNSGRSDANREIRKLAHAGSFNSSVGILVVRTRYWQIGCAKPRSFQFLGRNSGRSDEKKSLAK